MRKQHYAWWSYVKDIIYKHQTFDGNACTLLTYNELAICKALGAKWVSMNDEPDVETVRLWSEKPKFGGIIYYDEQGFKTCVANIRKEHFPSVKSGECILLGDISADLLNYSAIMESISETEKLPSGESHIKITWLVHVDKTHTLEGAARAIPCDRATAARWQRKFFETVAKNRGLMD